MPMPKVAYVAVVVADAERAATALAREFGLARNDVRIAETSRAVPLLGAGQTALALFEPNDPFLGEGARPGVHHIALEVDDVHAAAGHMTAAGVAVDDARLSPGLGKARRLLLSPRATAGVRTYLTEPIAGPTPAVDGPVERIDHIGVASADNAAAIDAFCSRLGCPLESTQTDVELSVAVETFTSDRYGVVSHTRPAQVVGGLRVAFVTVGDCELEFLQDLEPTGEADGVAAGPGNTRGDRGAIARYVASKGAGLHHLALKVRDIDAMLESLQGAGYALIDKVGRPGSRHARIGFLHPRALGGVLVHLVERQPR
jgi:catechol 2,3-dioxygenase-like lactoylglutathione lyase family enzyme